MTWWFVYIIQCKDGSYYTGSTTNILRRYNQHVAGKASKYTRSKKVHVLAWWSVGQTRSNALRMEANIKKLSHKEKERLVGGTYTCVY